MLNEKLEKRPSGAKALVDLIALAARLKSCPDASCPFERLFPQPVKARLVMRLYAGVETPASLRTGFFRSLFSPCAVWVDPMSFPAGRLCPACWGLPAQVSGQMCWPPGQTTRAPQRQAHGWDGRYGRKQATLNRLFQPFPAIHLLFKFRARSDQNHLRELTRNMPPRAFI
jgi:hypothetical protein